MKILTCHWILNLDETNLPEEKSKTFTQRW